MMEPGPDRREFNASPAWVCVVAGLCPVTTRVVAIVPTSACESSFRLFTLSLPRDRDPVTAVIC